MKRVVAWVVLGWLALLALTFIAGKAGLRLNTSASVPRGFYWLSSRSPERGAFVAVCLPREPLFELARVRGYLGHGQCAGGYAELIKMLAAAAGDHVSVDASGVRVENRYWPSSAPEAVDALGRSLPQLSTLDTAVPSESVLLMSQDCAAGFDGRYFGLLPRSAIVATAVPLLTW